MPTTAPPHAPVPDGHLIVADVYLAGVVIGGRGGVVGPARPCRMKVLDNVVVGSRRGLVRAGAHADEYHIKLRNIVSLFSPHSEQARRRDQPLPQTTTTNLATAKVIRGSLGQMPGCAQASGPRITHQGVTNSRPGPRPGGHGRPVHASHSAAVAPASRRPRAADWRVTAVGAGRRRWARQPEGGPGRRQPVRHQGGRRWG
jgi:hypothetical protein